MSDIEFVPGLIVKPPHENAPDFVKAKLSIKRQELLDWLQSQTGEWINANINVARSGKYYCAVDNWKPERGGNAQKEEPPKSTGGSVAGDFEDSIPFGPLSKRCHW